MRVQQVHIQLPTERERKERRVAGVRAARSPPRSSRPPPGESGTSFAVYVRLYSAPHRPATRKPMQPGAAAPPAGRGPPDRRGSRSAAARPSPLAMLPDLDDLTSTTRSPTLRAVRRGRPTSAARRGGPAEGRAPLRAARCGARPRRRPWPRRGHLCARARACVGGVCAVSARSRRRESARREGARGGRTR